MRHLATRLEQEGGASAGLAFGKAVGQSLASVVLGIYFGAMGLLVSALFALHVYLVSTAQTTAEFMKGRWKRTPNPFDHGVCANWRKLLCECGGDGAAEAAASAGAPTPAAAPKLALGGIGLGWCATRSQCSPILSGAPVAPDGEGKSYA